MILDVMLTKYKVLKHFAVGLTNSGYTYNELGWINSQLALLEELINKESYDVINKLLQKTKYRLLKCIHKGVENIADLVNHSYNWYLAQIDNNELEWLNEKAIVFELENGCILVFSPNKLNNCDQYINSKWQ